MPSAKAVVAILLCAALGPTPASAAMRCDNALVQEGDYKVQVLLKCGEPLLVEREYECFPGDLGCAAIERWTYDFGPSRMLRILTFRNGRLARIEQTVRP